MNKKRILFSALLGCVSIFLVFFVYLYFQAKNYQAKILPNITVNSVSVGNLTKEQATSLLHRLHNGKNSFSISFLLDQNYISTLSAHEIQYRFPIKDIVDHAFLIGRDSHSLSSLYQFVTLILGLEHYNFEMTAQYDEAFIHHHLSTLNNVYYVEPQSARFVFEDNKVTAFQLDKPGITLNTDFAWAQLRKSLELQKTMFHPTIGVLLQRIALQPKIRLADINNLGITELVAEGTSKFAGSHDDRVHNIITGSAKINGIIIKPGETFSFVKAVGDISQATGFVPAFVISQGKTVLGDGGGICQVSTTLFRTALRAGLPIVERNAHAYRVGYYEQDAKPGLDATIFSPSVDLKFTNNYDRALLLQTTVNEEDMTATFQLFGTKDDRQIEIGEPVVWNVQPAPPSEYIDDFTLPIGVTKQVDFAAAGGSSKFTYKVSKKNQVLFEKEFFSTYRPWKAIYLVGKKT
ncbi:MAG: VanW family protein [Patescibacteria group bacterium]|jgi:vancomycin resistance protein YoaR